MQGPPANLDGGEEEEEEEEGPAGRRVRRCPEAQVLQTLASAGRPAGGFRAVGRSYQGASSLPAIQEKPLQEGLQQDAGSRRCRGRQSPPRPPPSAPAAPAHSPGQKDDGAAVLVTVAGLGQRRKGTPRGAVWSPRAVRAALWSAPSLSPFGYLRGCDVLPTTKQEVQELAQRRPGFVRLAAARLEALLASADRLRLLLQAGVRAGQQEQPALPPPPPPPPPPLPPPPPPQQQQWNNALSPVQSDSRIVPLHSPGGSGGSGGPSPPSAGQSPLWTSAETSGSAAASFRFRRAADAASLSSASSSSSSSPPHFDEELLRNISWALASATPASATPPLLPLPADPSLGRGPRTAASEQSGTRLPSVGSCCCRICQNSASTDRLISPCNCKGSLAYVHLSCLERWLNQSGRTYCELCQFQFNAVQTPRYTRAQSLRLWYRHPRNRRGLLADALIWAVMTLVTAALLAVTTVGMRYFVGEATKLGISAFTTHGTLVFFLGLVAIGYLVTVVVLVRDQVVPWLRWWRGLVDVRLTLDPGPGGPRGPRGPRPARTRTARNARYTHTVTV